MIRASNFFKVDKFGEFSKLLASRPLNSLGCFLALGVVTSSGFRLSAAVLNFSGHLINAKCHAWTANEKLGGAKFIFAS